MKWFMSWFRVDNPFTLMRRYSSKRHSSFLYYHMKLQQYHVDISNYNQCWGWFKNLSHIYNEFFWKKKNPSKMFERFSKIRPCTVTNEKLTIDNKQIGSLFAGYNLSSPCLWRTWFYVMLNDESRFKWILKHTLNLPDALLDKLLDYLKIR